MRKQTKYQRKKQKSRDCTKCKKFGGFIGKNYFLCTAEMFEDQRMPKCHDVYDRDVLKKGTCSLFVPKEVEELDLVHSYITVECSIEEDDQSLPDKE